MIPVDFLSLLRWFLVNNPQYDTATDVIEIRCLAKSHVSISIKALEQADFLKNHYLPDNKKTAHLTVCEKADGLIAGGRQAQEQFFLVSSQEWEPALEPGSPV